MRKEIDASSFDSPFLPSVLSVEGSGGYIFLHHHEVLTWNCKRQAEPDVKEPDLFKAQVTYFSKEDERKLYPFTTISGKFFDGIESY
jgi:hypothetical protein